MESFPGEEEFRLFSNKEELIDAFREISQRGCIQNQRSGNAGGVGNTLEDLLGIEENNLPLANALDWELKAQRRDITSLITLFHMAPSPRGARIVPNVLLPRYGWQHKQAGTKYPSTERSFRSTTSATGYTDRGFIVVVNRDEEKVEFSFNASKVDNRHSKWLASVESITGLGEINPQPYWGFQDLMYKAGTKLRNTFYVIADREMEEGIEYYHYSEVHMLENFSFNNFLRCIEQGLILIDFDARTGHNHGTKFRFRQNNWPELYETCKRVL